MAAPEGAHRHQVCALGMTASAAFLASRTLVSIFNSVSASLRQKSSS